MDILANKLGKTRETVGEHWVHRYANGLVVHTDPFMRRDTARVLPIGGPQDVIMNRLIHWPDIVRGRRVLDVFAGSGVFGLLALKLGAAHVDFVDVSPRAVAFSSENCRRNGYAPASFKVIQGSVADFHVERPYDLILANPPFVMTPPGIEGTLCSRAGPEGNELVALLVDRLELLLAPSGEAYIYVLQLVQEGRPLIADILERNLIQRIVELTPVQDEIAPFGVYVTAYQKRFPNHSEDIRRWERGLWDRYGPSLGVQHYVMHIQPRGAGPTSWSITSDLSMKYGEGFSYPKAMQDDMALGRVAENFILPGVDG
jgi:SAM-dependent methyltransferase